LVFIIENTKKKIAPTKAATSATISRQPVGSAHFQLRPNQFRSVVPVLVFMPAPPAVAPLG
jgi:hypothetical protein